MCLASAYLLVAVALSASSRSARLSQASALTASHEPLFKRDAVAWARASNCDPSGNPLASTARIDNASTTSHVPGLSPRAVSRDLASAEGWVLMSRMVRANTTDQPRHAPTLRLGVGYAA